MAKKKKEKLEEQNVEIKLDEIPVDELPPIEEIKLDKAKEDELPPIEVIDTNNKSINNEAIDGNFVPKSFVPLKRNEKIGTKGIYNGRIYKIVRQNVGMWCDNGKLFQLTDLK